MPNFATDFKTTNKKKDYYEKYCSTCKRKPK